MEARFDAAMQKLEAMTDEQPEVASLIRKRLSPW